MSLGLGFFIPPMPPEDFIKMALRAEEVGYDFVTCDDHMIYPFDAPYGEDEPGYGIHDAWTAMTYIAGATSRISVSHMVLVTTFAGKYYQLENAEVTPKSLQRPHPPIWIGGDSRRSKKLAADLGDGWLVHGHQPGEINSMFENIRPMLGEKAEHFGLGMAAFVIMGSDQDDATRKMKRMISPRRWARFQKAGIRHEINNRISGTPGQCLDKIKEYERLGLTRLICIFLDPDDAERFAQEVMPRLS